jgi:hypothetical protein
MLLINIISSVFNPIFKSKMNKNILLFLGFALFFGIDVQKVQAQASVTAQAFAEIIAALTATETSQLNFGKFSPEVQGGQVIVSPDGVRTANGSVILSGGSANSGIFYLTGAPDAAFSIQLPDGPAVLTHQNSTNTMMVDNWISTPQPGTGTGVLADGQQFVYLGATLHVGSMLNNPVGLYSGTFILTFAYN